MTQAAVYLPDFKECDGNTTSSAPARAQRNVLNEARSNKSNLLGLIIIVTLYLHTFRHDIR